jgi:hypothetical protein
MRDAVTKVLFCTCAIAVLLISSSATIVAPIKEWRRIEYIAELCRTMFANVRCSLRMFALMCQRQCPTCPTRVVRKVRHCGRYLVCAKRLGLLVCFDREGEKWLAISLDREDRE